MDVRRRPRSKMRCSGLLSPFGFSEPSKLFPSFLFNFLPQKSFQYPPDIHREGGEICQKILVDSYAALVQSVSPVFKVSNYSASENTLENFLANPSLPSPIINIHAFALEAPSSLPSSSLGGHAVVAENEPRRLLLLHRRATIHQWRSEEEEEEEGRVGVELSLTGG